MGSCADRHVLDGEVDDMQNCMPCACEAWAGRRCPCSGWRSAVWSEERAVAALRAIAKYAARGVRTSYPCGIGLESLGCGGLGAGPTSRMMRTMSSQSDRTTEVPRELLDAAATVRRGEPVAVSVRTLLAWFHHAQRGGAVVTAIDDALRACDLSTTPDYARAWIDDAVGLVPRRAVVMATLPTSPFEEQAGAVAASDRPAEPDDAFALAGATSMEKPPGGVVPVGRDPVQRVGALAAANRPLSSILPSESLLGAFTVMNLRDLAHLAIADRDQRRAFGVITWPSLSRVLMERADPGAIRAVDCASPVRVCNHDEDLFEVARKVQQDGCVLVRGREGRLHGPLALRDLAEIFGEQLEPFVLAGEVERTLRDVVEAALPEAAAAMRERRPPSLRNAPLGLGECQAILREPARWEELILPMDRARFIAELDNVREIRNDLVHFNPDGVDAGEVKRLRAFAVALRTLTASVLRRRGSQAAVSESAPVERLTPEGHT